MLNITVKTLDSSNYQLQAEDDWTVRQFKEHIRSTVDVDSDEQRLIFCGRVLQDDKKLTEYDCNDKVIHLVRRPPPPPASAQEASADSNNNDPQATHADMAVNASQPNPREPENNNILLSAMTVGHEAIMNSILRHNLSYHQTSNTSATTDGRSTEPNTMTEIDRQIQNASRLTVSAINEYMRIAMPQNSSRQGQERSSITSPVTIIMTASSHTDLPRDSEPHNQAQTSRATGHYTTSERMDTGGSVESSNRPTTSTASTLETEYQRLREAMRNHPSWLPIIEADINTMRQQQNDSNNTRFFSDAYLSAIPRKRRRILKATSDRVLILQPSPSEAILNLLKRAILNSNNPIEGSLESVLKEISDDVELHTAYDSYIKSSVEARLKSDNDYCPEKFENSSKYFK